MPPHDGGNWPEILKKGDRSAHCAALLVNLDEKILEEHLFAATRSRFALANEHKYEGNLEK